MINDTVKYLVFDIESVPDGKLIKKVRFPGEDCGEDDAVARYREELMASSNGSSDFIPVTFQFPVSIVIAKVLGDFSLEDVVLLDEPRFSTGEMAKLFWTGIEKTYAGASMVTFNGRGFDLPLMELMAFRYGLQAQRHFKDQYAGRHRFSQRHMDLHDWLSNFGAVRLNGGLDLLAKVIGKPGKMGTRGDQVYDLFRQGEIRRINDYCVHDVLDTYFVFLRTRVMLAEMTLAREQEMVKRAKNFISENVQRIPAFKEYLDNWGDWEPWP